MNQKKFSIIVLLYIATAKCSKQTNTTKKITEKVI